jgi:hypothetical protein
LACPRHGRALIATEEGRMEILKRLGIAVDVFCKAVAAILVCIGMYLASQYGDWAFTLGYFLIPVLGVYWFGRGVRYVLTGDMVKQR